jgi:hypothetical protein
MDLELLRWRGESKKLIICTRGEHNWNVVVHGFLFLTNLSTCTTVNPAIIIMKEVSCSCCKGLPPNNIILCCISYTKSKELLHKQIFEYSEIQ